MNKDSNAFPIGRSSGLTKKEFLATIILGGIAGPTHPTTDDRYYEIMAQTAIKLTNALINELNQEEGK